MLKTITVSDINYTRDRSLYIVHAIILSRAMVVANIGKLVDGIDVSKL